jgi:hypothetical protein
MSELRQRSTKKEEAEKEKELKKEEEKPSPAELAEAEDSSFSWLDVARGIVFLLLLSGLTSYFITRSSFVWNVGRPSWTRPAVIQAWIVRPLSSSALSAI